MFTLEDGCRKRRVSSLLIPHLCADMVSDNAAPGVTEEVKFLLDSTVLVGGAEISEWLQ